ncbi:MAG: hypothetical protein MUE69_34040 [Myxococcota bacterium]|jgi:hypothetical protein|nr:hypothetical protein [Myxococcota bacterium]
MSSSLFNALVRTDSGEVGDYSADEAALARVLASNAAHLADQSAQVIAAWRVSTYPVIRDEDAALNELGIAASDYLIWSSAPFHARFRPDGQGYRIRPRVLARTVNGNAARLHVRIVGTGEAPGAPTGNVRVLEYAFTSTTAAWLTSPTGGDGNGNVYLPDAGGAIRDLPTLNELGGSRVVMPYTEARIQLWGNPAGGSTGDRIEVLGFYAAEYIGE